MDKNVVYVVEYTDYEDHEILGIYTSRQGAQARLAESATTYPPSFLHITTLTLDEAAGGEGPI